MVWFEYNIHIRNQVFNGNIFLNPIGHYNEIRRILLDLVKPAIDRNRLRLNHWHYLIENDVCRVNGYSEIRVRFDAITQNAKTVKKSFIGKLNWFARNNPIVMRSNEPLGSHEGNHGRRNQKYSGELAHFTSDWNTIVEILEKGSENAIEILDLGGQLTQHASLKLDFRWLVKPYYLHLPANQILVE